MSSGDISCNGGDIDNDTTGYGSSTSSSVIPGVTALKDGEKTTVFLSTKC